ncbi:CAP-associated domain-containing protein [Staphylococcus sp. 17KM0847]|uniref:CAP-associated domain-containing protein n=1 Tax=Staphylococcus sp. 17KM0847 TaxID=2583989 RepID=UPI0015DCCCE2|nr:CAP-associated domain-containing protein [Staphylococcus sp. 17KM0847]QLK85760.1 SCP-like extracellular protein [Staphylococcus sp. 17KM0847]
MKRLIIKILAVIVLIGFVIYLFYAPRLEFDVLENPNQSSNRPLKKAEPHLNVEENPKLKDGLGLLIGKNMTSVSDKLGQADRVYQALENNKTYVYHRKDLYVLVTAQQDKVKSIYMTGTNTKEESGPIQVGDDASTLYNKYTINTEPEFQFEGKYYHFELSDRDVKTQALIQFDNIFAQVFIDQQSNEITGIRYLDKEALITINPYSQNEDHTEDTQNTKEIYSPEQNANQLLTLYELTNEMRQRYQREPLKVNATLENVATVNLFHSIDGSSTEFTESSLIDLVNQTSLSYQSISQNVGYNFNDVPTLVNSWINSDVHRSRMLSSKYSEMGGQIDRDYYLLIFVERGEDQNGV